MDPCNPRGYPEQTPTVRAGRRREEFWCRLESALQGWGAEEGGSAEGAFCPFWH